MSKQIPTALGILIIILIIGISGIIILFLNQENKETVLLEKDIEDEVEEIVENNDSIMAGTKADGYYVELFINFYPRLLEQAINNSNISLLKTFFGNEDVAKEHKRLIEILQGKGTNFKVDDFTYFHDFDTLFQGQEIKIIFSYTNKYGEKEQIVFDYFFEIEEIRNEHGEGNIVIVKMREQK